MPANLLGTSEFALEVRRVALEQGAQHDHPRFAGRFARSVATMIIDGLVPAQRIRGRWYVEPRVAPEAARLMGLVPYNSYANENPPTGANG